MYGSSSQSQKYITIQHTEKAFKLRPFFVLFCSSCRLFLANMKTNHNETIHLPHTHIPMSLNNTRLMWNIRHLAFSRTHFLSFRGFSLRICIFSSHPSLKGIVLSFVKNFHSIFFAFFRKASFFFSFALAYLGFLIIFFFKLAFLHFSAFLPHKKPLSQN